MDKNEWTQKQLAEKVKMNTSVLNRIIKGKRPVDQDEIVAFSKVFGVTTDYLLGISGHPDVGVGKDGQLEIQFPEKVDSFDPAEIKKEFDSLAEINKIIDELGIEGMFFNDIEAWKNFTPEDVEDLRKHFEWIAHRAQERNKEKK